MTIRSFIEARGRPDRRLAVVGDDGPLAAMLVDLFGDQLPVALEDADDGLAVDESEDALVVLDDETIVARSPLSSLYDALLAINSDLFVTGAREVDEVVLPDALAALDDIRFRLRGYPLAHKEKLFLIVVSRWIERRALEAGGGTLRSSFQHLSRIDDEIGTRRVYERLGDADVSVHVYGVGDADPRPDVTVHTGTDEEYRRSWFVVFRPDESATDPAALVCLEDEPRVWDGFFTYDRERIAAIDDYINEAL
ncbi:histidine kinase [Halobacteria archaeon AArc-dxtr1]|nr:histidine kinase [Halobacteria archaeon AArc-dxtr1]